MSNPKKALALGALICGVFALGASLIGICGVIVSLLGGAVAVLALFTRSEDSTQGRTISIVALVVNGLALVLSIVNIAVGAWMMQTGQHPLFPQQNTDAPQLQEPQEGDASVG